MYDFSNQFNFDFSPQGAGPKYRPFSPEEEQSKLVIWNHSHTEQKDSRVMLLMIENRHRNPVASANTRYPTEHLVFIRF